MSGLSGLSLDLRIAEVLELVGLTEARRHRVAHLSGGTVQKLVLAQALLHDPKILIMDEPLSGLDPTSRYQVKNIIRDIAQDDRIVFFSSHILQDVEDIATKIAILNNGSVQKVGTPQELRGEFSIGNIVEISTSDSLKSLEQKLDFVERVDRSRAGKSIVHIRAGVSLKDATRLIIKTIVEFGIDIDSFTTAQPSLEDVYLHYVEGRR